MSVSSCFDLTVNRLCVITYRSSIGVNAFYCSVSKDWHRSCGHKSCARSALVWQAQPLVVTSLFATPLLSDKTRVCTLFGLFHTLIMKCRRQSERAVEYFATLVYGSGQTSTIVNAQRHRSLQFGPTSLRLVYMEHKASWM